MTVISKLKDHSNKSDRPKESQQVLLDLENGKDVVNHMKEDT